MLDMVMLDGGSPNICPYPVCDGGGLSMYVAIQDTYFTFPASIQQQLKLFVKIALKTFQSS